MCISSRIMTTLRSLSGQLEMLAQSMICWSTLSENHVGEVENGKECEDARD